MSGKPKPTASSTPKLCTVSRRKPIHQDSVSIQSPIERELSRSTSTEEFHSYTAECSNCNEKYIEERLVQPEKEYESSSSDEEKNIRSYCFKCGSKFRSTPRRSQLANDPEYQEQLLKRSRSEKQKRSNKIPESIVHSSDEVQFYIPVIKAVLLVVLVVVISISYCFSTRSNEDYWKNFNELPKKYSRQSEEFWSTVKVMIEDVQNMNQPKSLVFVYSEGNYATVKEIISSISRLAICILSNCNSSVVKLVPEDFSTREVMHDYGKIIARTKAPLAESGVMIVENIEGISGESAQAFHSLCDEYNPVVGKALFLFTLEMNKPPSKEAVFSVIRDQLKIAWKDLNEDKFHPLVTRVANVILPIMPEY
ncbi:unnamed protein product [Acanthoscelides obtectus]|uniref:Uncharacterized protein n=1 Tax=Acanthoscelides obtectus TaxID=200917 RepID=A0A9P0PI02_ACAOB|nr:unnamed protein product [Acanthoscelides obtectus]CAK1622204.1 hypothetical protein AOBTE_LOCUS1369 [Acanthoscelides obtectus]